MKSILLCAGRGTRLGELTRDRPKALLDVGGKPLIAHSLDWLAREGVTDVLINLHYLPGMIPSVVGDGGAFGLRVNYSVEDELLGTAGTVRAARDWIGREDVLVVYGDVLTDQPLADMWEQHKHTASDATLLLHKRVGSNSVVVMDDERRITSFLERPAPSIETIHQATWVNSVIQLLAPHFVDDIPSSVPVDLPRDIYQHTGEHKLFGFPLSGSRIAVDSRARLAEANRLFSESHGAD